MKNLLNTLPQDYFEHRIADEQPRKKQNLLAALFAYLLLFMFIPSNYLEREAPAYVAISKYVWLLLCLVYAIFCVFCNAKKGSPVVYIMLSMMSMALLCIEIFLIISHFAIVLCCESSYGNLDPQKTAVVSIFALLLLCAGMIINVFVYRRLKKRVIGGCYRKGGNGFWDNRKRRDLILRLLGIIAPLSMSFSTSSIFLSKFWRITWNEAYIPVVAVVGPMLIVALFLPFSYFYAISLMRIYYIKRFGSRCPDRLPAKG